MSKNTTPTIETNFVISPQVIQFVEQYKLCVKKTAQSILELANVVFNAKNELSNKQFQEFRQEIGADFSKDSYIKKLCVIAGNQTRFAGIQDKLPGSYTTLYTLAKIDDKSFARVIDARIISPQMTAARLSKCLKMSTVSAKSKKTSLPHKQCVKFALDLENIAENVAQKVIAEISAICDKYLIPVECLVDQVNAYFSEQSRNEVYEERLAA